MAHIKRAQDRSEYHSVKLSTPVSCLECSQFKPWPGNWLFSWHFSQYSSEPPGECQDDMFEGVIFTSSHIIPSN